MENTRGAAPTSSGFLAVIGFLEHATKVGWIEPRLPGSLGNIPAGAPQDGLEVGLFEHVERLFFGVRIRRSVSRPIPIETASPSTGPDEGADGSSSKGEFWFSLYDGRSPGTMVSPLAMTTACSIACSSSRTFPGHFCSRISRIASTPMRPTSRFMRRAYLRKKW